MIGLRLYLRLEVDDVEKRKKKKKEKKKKEVLRAHAVRTQMTLPRKTPRCRAPRRLNPVLFT
jgi:hypothetical protein